jgi:aspartyl-tRNA(Asn)/glutamyl-tRNA(Gln) amidotransferase subunit A
MNSMNELPRTISGAAEALRAGRLTSSSLVEALQARADRVDPELGIYLSRFDDTAMAAAARADAELAAGRDRGPLHGIPVAVKDIITTEEGPTTAQSLVLDRAWGGGRDAPVVARLRQAGAVITGKTSTMEFAIGLPDPTKPFPVPRNPWDPATWPGGSSSGTGSGLAAGLFLGGLGTDTGGSIRIPATFCGITGLKPTFGRVPKTGCVPLGYSFDTIGPMARSAGDCALMLTAMAGPDPDDPCTVDVPLDDYAGALGQPVAGLRVGAARPHRRADDVDPDLAPCFDSALQALAGAGAEVVDLEIPHYRELCDATLVASGAEAFAYHRADLGERWTDYGAGTRAYIAIGALYSAADYVAAQRVRRIGQKAVARLFESVDVIAMPTTAIAAPELAALDPGRMLEAIYTLAWNAVGLPTLALPMGFNAGGLPLGMQLTGRPWEETTVLRVGDAYQAMTDWHVRAPATLTAMGEKG